MVENLDFWKIRFLESFYNSNLLMVSHQAANENYLNSFPEPKPHNKSHLSSNTSLSSSYHFAVC